MVLFFFDNKDRFGEYGFCSGDFDIFDVIKFCEGL